MTEELPSSSGTSAPAEAPPSEAPPASGVMPPPDPPATMTSSPDGSGGRRWLWALVVIAILAVVGFFTWQYVAATTVPEVVGLSQQEAEKSLSSAGLVSGDVVAVPTLEVEPGTVTSQTPPPGERSAKGSAVDLTIASIPAAEVPDVVGLAESEAEAQLAAAGLRLGDVEGTYTDEVKPGIVMSQQPSGGETLTVGAQVDLEISLGTEKSAVPDVVGLTTSDAVSTIEEAGFTAKQTKKTSTDVPAGAVVSQNPTAGTVAEAGSTVSLVVSTGEPAKEEPTETPGDSNGSGATGEPDNDPTQDPQPEPAPDPAPQPDPKPDPAPDPKPETATVPDIVGLQILEALKALRDARLGFTFDWGPSDEYILKVAAQDPKAGAEVDPGTPVTMTIGLPQFLFDGIEIQPLPAEPEDSGSSAKPEGGDSSQTEGSDSTTENAPESDSSTETDKP